jgi:hypothetical protein
MPIDLLSTAKKTSQWAFGSSLINSMLGSSLFVAVMIALTMILLIMILYPAKSGTPFSIVVKMFIYMFIGSLFIVFLHDGVIRHLYDEENAQDKSDTFLQGATIEGRSKDPSYAPMYKTITPTSSVSGGYNMNEVSDTQEDTTPVNNNIVGSGTAGGYISVVDGGSQVGSLRGVHPRKIIENPYK